jgi:hypothetical protein
MNTKSKKKWFVWLLPGLLLLCLALTGISALVNLGVPRQSAQVENLSTLDMARLAEYQHLRAALGEAIFPGFGTAVIPALLYNEQYAFLVGLAAPQNGWYKVPQEELRGGSWQALQPEQEISLGEVYRTAYDPQKEPDAFTVRVGETYVSSMPTLEWFRISLMHQFRTDLPGFIKPVFPYQLVASIFVPNSDRYISLVAHESFHAYQATWARERFDSAEQANLQFVDQYPWFEQTTIDSWQQELDVLQRALKETDISLQRSMAKQFLDLRQARRVSMGLSEQLAGYESQREWVEGMARYVELRSLQLAQPGGIYQPMALMQSDRDFKQYAGFENRWLQELDQMTRMAGDEGDGRFYYSGMAQAYLLDTLLPDWKEKLHADPLLNLEDLLAEAVNSF